MSRSPNMVAVVLDGSYSKLRETSQQMAVWAVDTSVNRTTMTELWSEAKAPSNDLTLFRAADGMSRESQLLSQVPTIEIHHPEATTFLLIGIFESAALADGLLQLGYSLEKRGDALLATKQEQ